TQTIVSGTALRLVLFFFSSRRRHTRFSRDWSSDVCSSDLRRVHRVVLVVAVAPTRHVRPRTARGALAALLRERAPEAVLVAIQVPPPRRAAGRAFAGALRRRPAAVAARLAG